MGRRCNRVQGVDHPQRTPRYQLFVRSKARTCQAWQALKGCGSSYGATISWSPEAGLSPNRPGMLKIVINRIFERTVGKGSCANSGAGDPVRHPARTETVCGRCCTGSSRGAAPNFGQEPVAGATYRAGRVVVSGWSRIIRNRRRLPVRTDVEPQEGKAQGPSRQEITGDGRGRTRWGPSPTARLHGQARSRGAL